METESFRERNRQRRVQNAYEHLLAYAEARSLPDPEATAREAAERLHGAGAAAPAPSPRRARAAPKASASPSVPHRLEDRTKEQLYARAQELDVEGRSQMTKDELIAAIRAKQ